MSSYYFSSMKPKADRFRSQYVSSTSSSTYSSWQTYLEDEYSARYWRKLCARYGETGQFDILRAVTVVGIDNYHWSDIFYAILEEFSPFGGLAKTYLQSRPPTWRFFADKLAKESRKITHYPAVCPEWLFAYGYSQQQYLQDLDSYWEKVHDDYYIPWATTRLGGDSPEIARLKKIGQEARREIDEVARHSVRRNQQ